MAREKDANSRFASRFENLNDFVRDLLPFSICFTIPTCMSYTTKANRVGLQMSSNVCGIFNPNVCCTMNPPINRNPFC